MLRHPFGLVFLGRSLAFDPCLFDVSLLSHVDCLCINCHMRWFRLSCCKVSVIYRYSCHTSLAKQVLMAITFRQGELFPLVRFGNKDFFNRRESHTDRVCLSFLKLTANRCMNARRYIRLLAPLKR